MTKTRYSSGPNPRNPSRVANGLGWNDPNDPPPRNLIVEIIGADFLHGHWIMRAVRTATPSSKKSFWQDQFGRPILINRPTGWRHLDPPKPESASGKVGRLGQILLNAIF